MNKDTLYTLMPLEEFKSVLDIDDREDKLAACRTLPKFRLIFCFLELRKTCYQEITTFYAMPDSY